jgi:hypothetical protein
MGLPPEKIDKRTFLKQAIAVTGVAELAAISSASAADSAPTRADAGAALFPRTVEEIAADVTPVNFAHPYLDIRRYGAVGDGVTDCTAALQTVIDLQALRSSRNKTSPLDSQPVAGGVLSFPRDEGEGAGIYLISAPLRIEQLSGPIKQFHDNFQICGNGAVIRMSSEFRPVSRLYDSRNSDTLHFAFVFGARHYGSPAPGNRGSAQCYIRIRDLTLQGVIGNRSYGAFWHQGVCQGFQYQNVTVEHMRYGIAGRVMKHFQVCNYYWHQVMQPVWFYNDTARIHATDKSSTWSKGGQEGGACTFTNCDGRFDAADSDAGFLDTAAFEFYCTGECAFSNVKIFGGFIGFRWRGDTSSTVAGRRWMQISNLEIAATLNQAMHLENCARGQFTNLMLVWNHDTQGTALPLDAGTGHVEMRKCVNIDFVNVHIDRSKADPERYQGGEDIRLTDCTSCSFTGISTSGQPVDDDRFAHVSLNGRSTFNTFSDCQFNTQIFGRATTAFRHCFAFASGCDYNVGRNIQVLELKADNRELSFADQVHHNDFELTRFARAARSTAGAGDRVTVYTRGTRPSLDNGDTFVFAYRTPAKITDFTTKANGKAVTLLFTTPGVTLANGENIVTGTGGDITPAPDDVLQLKCFNARWYVLNAR